MEWVRNIVMIYFCAVVFSVWEICWRAYFKEIGERTWIVRRIFSKENKMLILRKKNLVKILIIYFYKFFVWLVQTDFSLYGAEEGMPGIFLLDSVDSVKDGICWNSSMKISKINLFLIKVNEILVREKFLDFLFEFL